MANQQRTSKGLKSVFGAALLALGFLLLFVNLDAVEASASKILGSQASSGLECIPAIILATSHALQTYAFDHEGFLFVVQQILISFWPLILVIAGAALLRSSFGNRRRQYAAGTAVEDLGSRS